MGQGNTDTLHTHITLLGSFELRSGDSVLTSLRSRRALAVLAYLLVQRQPVARQTLLEVVWSDKAPAAAKANLSWALTYLGSLLPDTIERDQESVWLRTDVGLVVDLWRLWDEDVSVLPQANLLLDGFYLTDSAEFELWLLSTRETVRDQLTSALHDSIDRCRLASNLQLATSYASRLIDLDPWSETTCQIMMELLARQQQYELASAEYERLRGLLSAELNTTPSTTTSDLHKHIVRLSERPRLHLPAQPTQFVGRQPEIDALAQQLRQPATRLLTLHAIGGMGKTRAAVEVGRALAADFLDGVHFISLVGAAQLADPIASTLTQRDAITPIASGDVWGDLCMQMATCELLLVLDNFELLVDQAAHLTVLLAAAPKVKLLVTSRLPLNLPVETVVPLAGLEMLAAADLFKQVVEQVRPQLPVQPTEQASVAQICQLVDGMPLGVELAASWLRLQSAETIAQQLASDLDLLHSRERDRPSRQRTMHTVFDYTWQQLSADLRTTLQQLSIFVGSFSAEAALAVTGATHDGLTQLIRFALLQSNDNRYQLHPLLQQFLREKSAESADYPQLQARYSHYFIDRFTTVGRQAHEGIVAEEVAIILPDFDDFSAAWHWAAAHEPLALEAIALLLRFIISDRGFDEAAYTLAVTALDALVEKPAYARLRRRLRLEQAYCLFWHFNRQAEALALMAASQQELAILPAGDSDNLEELAQVHTLYGWYYEYFSDDMVQAERYYQAAVACHEQLGNDMLIASRLLDLGNIAFGHEQFAVAEQHWQRCATLARQTNNLVCVACAHYSLGRIALVQGGWETALKQLDYTQPFLTHHHGLNAAWHRTKGLIAAVCGDYAEAQRFFELQLAICQRYERAERVVAAYCNLGRLARLLDDEARAARYFRQAHGVADGVESAELRTQIAHAEQLTTFTPSEA